MIIIMEYNQSNTRSSVSRRFCLQTNSTKMSPVKLRYRYRNSTLVIEPDEAEIILRVFREYLAGKGVVAIAKGLNEDGIPTRYGNKWYKASVSGILRDYTYTGNLLLQKTFRENHLTKRTLPNKGKLP